MGPHCLKMFGTLCDKFRKEKLSIDSLFHLSPNKRELICLMHNRRLLDRIIGLLLCQERLNTSKKYWKITGYFESQSWIKRACCAKYTGQNCNLWKVQMQMSLENKELMEVEDATSTLDVAPNKDVWKKKITRPCG